MTDDVERRLQLLEARVEALIQLSLSNIVASNELIGDVAAVTISIAEDQRREAVGKGQHLLGIVLGDLLAELQEVCDVPLPH